MNPRQIITSKENDTLILKGVDDGRSFTPSILGYSENVEDVEDRDAGITIEISSTFETTEGEHKLERIVSTNFTIVAPDYNSQITAINIYPVFDGKALTVDENMGA